MQEHAQAPTPDGWLLSFKRVPGDGPPVLLVPGFAMNSFILGFHPSGPSLMDDLASRGLDVWAVDLRGQGSNTRGPRRAIGLAERALIDLPAALRHVRRVTGAERVHLIGCSLGGTLVYTLLAHEPRAQVDRVVAIGAPLSWSDPNPLVKAFGYLGPVAGRIPIQGSRRAARIALPVLTRLAPRLLGIYMNPDNIDLARADQLVQTVEDPAPRIVRQLGAWIRHGEPVVNGVHVSQGLGQVDRDLLVVTGSGDGIAPESACHAVERHWGGRVQRLHVGTADQPWAHADLFIARDSHQRVFEPMARFLLGPR
jgi:pimeloyl-ACP methyl ester carboxylesterase